MDLLRPNCEVYIFGVYDGTAVGGNGCGHALYR